MKSSNQYRLLLLIGCGLAAASIGVCNNAIGVFYTPVSESLGILRGCFAFHATLQLLASALTALSIPKLLKKYSYKRLVVIGVLLSIVSTILMAFSAHVYLFYILGIIRGIGSGLFSMVPISILINNWYVKKHGLIMSITLSFSGLAGAISAPLFSSCIQSFGWKIAYLIMAGMILVFTLPALCIPFTMTPEESHTVPYGGSIEKQSNSEVITFKYSAFYFLGLCILGLTYPALTGITQHFTGIAEAVGYTASLGAMMMSCAMIGNIVMKLCIGYLSDRFTVVKAICMMMSVNILSLLFLSFNLNSITMLIASFTFGSVYSVGAVGIPLFTRYIVGKENYGSAYTVIGFLTNIGSSLSLTLIGFLYDFTASYQMALFIGIGINLLCLCLVLSLYTWKRKQV